MDKQNNSCIKSFFIVAFFAIVSCNKGTLPIYFENKITDIANIDILMPAKSKLKHKISTLGVMQVNYTPEFQKIIFAHQEKETNITLQFIYEAIQSSYDGLFSEIQDRGIVEIVELTEPIDPKKSFDWANLKKITDSTGLDALIFINQVNVKFEIKTEIPADNYARGYHQSELNCRSNFFYTILYPNNKEFETVAPSFSDTFYGEENYVGSKAALLFASRQIEEALPYLCFETGKRLVPNIFPNWTTVERKFYGRASSELRLAKKLIDNGMWDEAIAIWKANKDHPNKVISKHCQYNLILAEEFAGNLENAIIMAKNYYYKYKEGIVLEYIKILETHLQQREILNNQLLQ